ncbi:MAG: hypothetical protein IJH68_02300 [Thermoguttaceae bacterium]|nr:hypothetical protein [Thermoguttaceae bacterium]MBQ6618963.1 hypothetical protein [Thermoguttaceae bacterium]
MDNNRSRDNKTRPPLLRGWVVDCLLAIFFLILMELDVTWLSNSEDKSANVLLFFGQMVLLLLLFSIQYYRLGKLRKDQPGTAKERFLRDQKRKLNFYRVLFLTPVFYVCFMIYLISSGGSYDPATFYIVATVIAVIYAFVILLFVL